MLLITFEQSAGCDVQLYYLK